MGCGEKKKKGNNQIMVLSLQEREEGKDPMRDMIKEEEWIE